jgi:corrinoid protein of di/trimethylamine methyltransferase
MTAQEILDRLALGVKDMDEEVAANAAREALSEGIDALTAINEGLVRGMNEAGRLYEEQVYFVPELLLCSDAMYSGLDILTPHVKRAEDEKRASMVIGVMQGDTHDIGKNLVKLMLEVDGLEVYDLGRDVPPADFVAKIKETGAELLGMSTLMSTTMDAMGVVIRMLQQEGLRDRTKVMVGGGPVCQAFADLIGADGYAVNATGAVRVARRLLSERGVACS